MKYGVGFYVFWFYSSGFSFWSFFFLMEFCLRSLIFRLFVSVVWVGVSFGYIDVGMVFS